MTRPLHIAVIGYGLGGRVFHAPYISAVEGLHLAAIVSSRKDEIAKTYPYVAVHNDPAAVFADPTIDAVVISTPNDSHAKLASQALDAGKHVVIDKPFAATAAEAEALMKKAKDRILTVFHNRRWDGDFLTLKELLRQGALGEVAYVETHFDLYRPAVSQRWRETPGPSSGAWYDLGSHLVDQILTLFGMPLGLTADLSILRKGGITNDYFRVLLRYERLRVILSGNYLARNDQRWVVHGSKASYVKWGLDPQQDQLSSGVAIGDPDFGVDRRPGTLVMPDGSAYTPAPRRGNYCAFYERFRDSMRGVAPVPVTAGEALAVMKLLARAEESAENHIEIGFAAVRESP